jgi:hypothetical protein
MPQSTTKGRGKASSIKTNTIPNKSATQAILRKQDEIIDRINALVNALEVAADTAAINAATLALADLQKVRLI